MTNLSYRVCTRCVMDTTDPLIEFDENGVCNHCHIHQRALAERVRTGEQGAAELEAIVATARDYGLKIACHAHGAEGMKRAIRAGVTTIEHGTYMDDEAMALMKKHGTWYVPTISAGQYVVDKAKIDGYFPDVVRPKAARIGAQIQDTFAAAYKAGVKIGFGTDMGVGPHGDNAQEFVYMVEAGMPAAAALQSATFNAAKVLGLS